MTMQEFVDYLDRKIEENENFIRITFYEIRVKYGLTEEESNKLLKLAKNKFENMGYSVYFTDTKYTYQNARMTVQPNELMIAIKCTTNEIKLLENIGINIEDKEYTNEELRRYENQIEDFIISHSTKNGDISKLSNQYSSILNTLVKGK